MSEGTTGNYFNCTPTGYRQTGQITLVVADLNKEEKPVVGNYSYDGTIFCSDGGWTYAECGKSNGTAPRLIADDKGCAAVGDAFRDCLSTVRYARLCTESCVLFDAGRL